MAKSGSKWINIDFIKAIPSKKSKLNLKTLTKKQVEANRSSAYKYVM